MEIKLNDETIIENLHYSILKVDFKYYYVKMVKSEKSVSSFIPGFVVAFIWTIYNTKYFLLK